MAPIYINAADTAAKKIVEMTVSDNIKVEANRPIVIVGYTSHFLISFKKGEVSLSIFEDDDSKLTKLASFNYRYIAIEPIVEAFCLLMGNLGVDMD